MQHAAKDESTRMFWGLDTLASIGSSSPFVGLLGTVWGIMATFQALSGAKSASLQVVAPGITEQTTRVLGNLKAILEAAGSSLPQVVKTTVFLKDFNDFAAMNAVYGAYLAPEGVAPPARTTVEVSRLPKDVLVEIELVAEV